MASASLNTRIVEVEKVVKKMENKCVGITLNLSIDEAFALFYEVGMSNGNMTWDVYKKLQTILDHHPINWNGSMMDIEKDDEFQEHLKKLKEKLNAI